MNIILLLFVCGILGCLMIWGLASFKNPLKAKNYPEHAWLPIMYSVPLIGCLPLSILMFILELFGINLFK